MLQKFIYNDNPITFDLNGEVMINASQMAKPFGKAPKDFLKNEQTQSFVMALQKQWENSPIGSERQDRNSGLGIVRVNRGGNNPGTWMHRKLALKFAAWLSADFELWVFDRIEEILLAGKSETTATLSNETYLQLVSDLNSLKKTINLHSSIITQQSQEITNLRRVNQSKSSRLPTLKEITAHVNMYVDKSLDLEPAEMKVETLKELLGKNWLQKLMEQTNMKAFEVRNMVLGLCTNHSQWHKVVALALAAQTEKTLAELESLKAA
ncbi:KilA-N domain-containing protein [Adhaeribacter aquaticus]|uniref:KilA-N domain-containing protein n=1 Tax=Adhaeribacter aquaticus TaxID=299567 RepID=UPI000429518C|nr:KilA-N domain-containing protein [Adhaeribacter aquaticus]